MYKVVYLAIPSTRKLSGQLIAISNCLREMKAQLFPLLAIQTHQFYIQPP